MKATVFFGPLAALVSRTQTLIIYRLVHETIAALLTSIIIRTYAHHHYHCSDPRPIRLQLNARPKVKWEVRPGIEATTIN